MNLENRTILIGDVIEKMKEIPEESIDVIITSPPYWGLRDYGVEGQWGLEPDFHDYLAKLRSWMNECKRVLKNSGTCWVNLGDTYAGGNAHSDWANCTTEFMGRRKETEQKFFSIAKDHIQRKSLYGIPSRFYTQCIDDGWVARNFIPWIKDNPMPTSVKDRFQNTYEPIFFFAKNPIYYFNLDAVRIKPKSTTKPFNRRVRENITGKAQKKLGDMAWTATKEEMSQYNEKGERGNYQPRKESRFGTGSDINKHIAEAVLHKQDQVIDPNTNKPKATYAGFNKRYKAIEGEPTNSAQLKERLAHARLVEGKPHDAALNNPKGKNPGDVFDEWKDTSDKGFDENGNCLGCGLPKAKHINSRKKNDQYLRDTEHIWDYVPCNPKGKNPGDVLRINTKPFGEAHFATFPVDLPLTILKAACPKDGFVLDPFFGSGTVGVAAEQLGLNWIGIELKLEYVSKIILKRLDKYKNERLDTWEK